MSASTELQYLKTLEHNLICYCCSVYLSQFVRMFMTLPPTPTMFTCKAITHYSHETESLYMHMHVSHEHNVCVLHL